MLTWLMRVDCIQFLWRDFEQNHKRPDETDQFWVMFDPTYLHKAMEETAMNIDCYTFSAIDRCKCYALADQDAWPYRRL